MRTRSLHTLLVVVLTLAGGVLTAGAATGQEGRAPVFPMTLRLPDGFQPEGIAIGPGPVAYFGSLADGSIFQMNLVTGEGHMISEGPGTPSVGLTIDRFGRLFVSGGGAGDARVVDVSSGRTLAGYQLATGPSFINDVVLFGGAAWFTDSLNPVLYKLPLGPGGQLPSSEDVVRLPLTGDLVYQPGFNLNGIAGTPDHKALLAVQSNTGELFRIDPRTGVTTEVDLGGAALPNGDGMLRHGTSLYVVQNRLNRVAELRLSPDGSTAELLRRVTDPRFDVPTTVAEFGDRLYLPNARFGTSPQPGTEYRVIAIPRP